MGDICKITIDHDYNVSNDCNDDIESTSKQVIRLHSKQSNLKLFPSISDHDQKHKNKIIDQMLSMTKQCYNNEMPGYVCQSPINLKVFKFEKCPSCKVQIPEYEKYVRKMKQKQIPVDLQIMNVKQTDAAKLFKQSGCTGTPCVILSQKGKPDQKICEGITGEVAFYSNILGIDNPLYNDLESYPKNLAQRR